VPLRVTIESPMGPLKLLVDHYQHDLLKDEDRTTALMSMVSEAVSSGGTFADLGAGTGPLAVVAALSGAERVIAVEINPRRAKLAEKNLRRYAPRDVKFEVVTADATEKPVNADVIACEMLDTLLLEEDFVRAVNVHLETYDPEVLPKEVHVGVEPVETAPPHPRYEARDPSGAEVLEIVDTNRPIPEKFRYETRWDSVAFHTWIEWDGRRIGGSEVFCPALTVFTRRRPVVGVRGGGLETLHVVDAARTR